MKSISFDEYAQLEQFISQEDAARIKAELLTCPEVDTSLTGTIIELSKNHAKSVLITSNEMVSDELGLIHDSFIFCAASYVAQAAVNKEYSMLIGSKNNFYSPLKLGDILILEAQALFDENSKKREVKVVGHVNEIKIFESSIQIVVTDDHIFRLKRPPSTNTKPQEEEKEEQKPNMEAAMAQAMLKNLAT
ncbi:hypothetical protein DMB92_01520 [Campylobacter sp. MIT 99-7217]|nr:hypothetical protein DMB92_01520 [Campylobacter sp. MIT 99-7217]